MSFAEYKRNSAQRFEKLRGLMRFNLGTHKRTRLRRAGCGDTTTLLHNDVAAEHGGMFAEDCLRHLGKRPRDEAIERLRFLTVLHSVERLEKKPAMQAVERMETALRRVFDGSGAWMLGAVEIEIVNIDLLQKISALTEDEARKLNVLRRLGEASSSNSALLVHFHGIVDLTDHGNLLLCEGQLRTRFKKVAAWQRSPYQIELKRLFKDRTISKNIRDIASYVTKGGNDQLRYNAGFGRDLGADLDAKIWRAGSGRADQGGGTVPDERGLTVGEVKFLDGLWRELMNRKRNKRGYLVGSDEAT
jgi:hypothetical protein